MSITYGLYNHSTKEWIDLGRDLSKRFVGGCFQTDSAQILRFLINSINCKLEIIADTEIRPSDYDYGKDKYKKIEKP